MSSVPAISSRSSRRALPSPISQLWEDTERGAESQWPATRPVAALDSDQLKGDQLLFTPTLLLQLPARVEGESSNSKICRAASKLRLAPEPYDGAPISRWRMRAESTGNGCDVKARNRAVPR